LSESCPAGVTISCDCRLKALDRSFALADSSLNAELLAGAQSDARCASLPGFLGFKAEALARIGSADAKEAIVKALANNADDAHALFAQAYQSVLAGEPGATAGLLDQAERAGRGAPVDTLRGVWQLRSRQTEPAKASFERAIAADPNEVDALYNLAALEATRGLYNRPRGLFLKVLKLRPEHLDARFALASLTFKAGATSEANRHATLLEASAPTGDTRVLRLRELMKAPRPAPASSAMGEVRVQSPAK
jgi:tetratricopeptide (TPR) repeat protein